MSKHTSRPSTVRRIVLGKRYYFNSHVHGYDEYPCGNWNKHKKRKVPSSMRTAGRRKRSILRHVKTIQGIDELIDIVLMSKGD